VIEQAKGVLAERYGFGVDRAFEVLRRASRASRIRIHLEAALVVSERSSPVEIEAAVLHLEGQALGD
jgi:AmiR/NasT family two-component response regulator